MDLQALYSRKVPVSIWVIQILLGCALSMSVAAQEVFGDFIYRSTGSTVSIIGYRGDGGHVVIPALINGQPVISVGGFSSARVTGVTIPDSVTHIGSHAFASTGLTEVTVPGSVTTIDLFAFSHCTSLASVTLGHGVSTIGTGAFATCESLTEIVIPDSVTGIGAYAFAGCTSLTTLTIPASVTSLGIDLFFGSTALQGISVHPDNTAYSTFDGVLFNKSQSALICYPRARTGSYRIPGGVTIIELRAFHGSGLTNLTIPASVTSIGDEAFIGCSYLTGIAFLGDGPMLGDQVFRFTPATIYYRQDAIGFTSPTWNGIPAKKLGHTGSDDPKALSFSRQPGSFSILAFGKAGRSYQLLRHNDLGPAEWSPVTESGPLETDQLLELTDPAADPARGIYRVRATEP